MLIIITGPPGSGKSTTAEILAEKFTRSAAFSIDTIRHFIKGGNIPPWETGKEAGEQMKLGDDIIKDIIKRYLDGGYVVVLDGVLGDEEMKGYLEIFSNVHGFILLPSLNILKQRDAMRPEGNQVPHRVEPLYETYTLQNNQLFETIDNSEKSAAEVSEYIYNKVNENNR